MTAGFWNSLRTAKGRFVVLFLLVLSLTVPALNAQTAGTGNIQGNVVDATGAIVQGASVTATNTATQTKHTAVTEGNGSYSFPNLDVGTYTVEVGAKGFQGYKQSNIALEVGSSIAVNVTLTIGTESQTIEVQATGIALQTEDSSFKQTIDQKTVTELPLNGRLMTQLITLSGGSVSANENNCCWPCSSSSNGESVATVAHRSSPDE